MPEIEECFALAGLFDICRGRELRGSRCWEVGDQLLHYLVSRRDVDALQALCPRAPYGGTDVPPSDAVFWIAGPRRTLNDGRQVPPIVLALPDVGHVPLSGDDQRWWKCVVMKCAEIGSDPVEAVLDSPAPNSRRVVALWLSLWPLRKEVLQMEAKVTVRCAEQRWGRWHGTVEDHQLMVFRGWMGRAALAKSIGVRGWGFVDDDQFLGFRLLSQHQWLVRVDVGVRQAMAASSAALGRLLNEWGAALTVGGSSLDRSSLDGSVRHVFGKVVQLLPLVDSCSFPEALGVLLRAAAMDLDIAGGGRLVRAALFITKVRGVLPVFVVARRFVFRLSGFRKLCTEEELRRWVLLSNAVFGVLSEFRALVPACEVFSNALVSEAVRRGFRDGE